MLFVEFSITTALYKKNRRNYRAFTALFLNTGFICIEVKKERFELTFDFELTV